MSPRRHRPSRGARGRRGDPGAGSLPGSGRPADLGRTGRSHWRADGAPKTRFADEDAAHRFALQVRLEHGHDLTAYRCPLCHGWHLGGSAD
jgi:hypothetical protein